MTETFNPECAIIVYRNREADEGEYYLERRVYNENTKSFGVAVPLTQKEYNEIASSIETDTYKEGLRTKGINTNLLHFHYNKDKLSLTWKVKASKKQLFFDKKLGIKSGYYYIPHLVFRLEGDNLSVYATKTFNINGKTKMYYAPFHNTYSNGNVCMGNARGYNQQKYVEDIIESWEEAFFNSTFTHFNYDKITKKNLVKTFKASVKAKKFDNDALMPYGDCKLEDII